MSELFGATRSVVTGQYALLTPAGFVASVLPGWQGAQCVVVIAPQLGAKFCQTLVALGGNGVGEGETAGTEYVLFVLEGELTVEVADRQERLAAGGYCYIPPGQSYTVRGGGSDSRLVLFQREYRSLAGYRAPAAIFGNEEEVAGALFLGDEAALLKTLLPDELAFDMAVNIFTFQPGATLPMVETHVMEHGMLMLQGQGIYRLAGDWYPVQTGDVIWMGPYCPQWFVATGKTPARYLYYKDVNRQALG